MTNHIIYIKIIEGFQGITEIRNHCNQELKIIFIKKIIRQMDIIYGLSFV